MKLLDELSARLDEGQIVDVRIGLHWTAVVAQVGGQIRCGLCSTLANPHEHGGEPQVPSAGQLSGCTGQELAALAYECERITLASVGVAAINALLPRPSPTTWTEGNAEHVLATYGVGKKVAIVGHFPFIPRLRSEVGELFVLERHPRDGDLPAGAAPEILPEAEIVAITGMALVNHSLESLLELCSPEATVMILGPSTPLSPVLFNYGVDFLSGSLVTDVEAVLRAISQAANFRQIHRVGVRLVTIARSDWMRSAGK